MIFVLAAYLRPSISSFSDKNIPEEKYTKYLGWHGSEFIIPGRKNDEITFQPEENLIYKINPDAKLEKGIICLQNLIETIDPQKSMILLSYMFQGSLARFFNEIKRYILFVRGMTGSFKTSICQVFMCLYGPDYINDDHLWKFGEGSTNNALNKMMTYCRDLPFFVDNFKPNTTHETKMIALIHNNLEGGLKRRMRKNGQLVKNVPIKAWPLFTGEDFTISDPATLARMIFLDFPKGTEVDIAKLTRAQELSPHLSAVSKVWLNHLEMPSFQKTIKSKNPELSKLQSKWRELLMEVSSSAQNVLRMAQNFAFCEITMRIMREIPDFKELVDTYFKDLLEGLKTCAREMARLTADGLEAQQFLEDLKELLGAGQVTIVSQGTRETYMNCQKELGRFDIPRNNVIGYEEDELIYLYPKVALKYVRGLQKIDISLKKLAKELDDMGLLARKGNDSRTVQKKIFNKNVRCLCLHKSALGFDPSKEDAA